MLKKAVLVIAGVLIAVVVIFCCVVAIQPADFKIVRATTMNATPEKIFEQVNDFHKWESWSPWAKIDPAMKTTFSGPQAGPGSSYAWVGNNDIGEGKMAITASYPYEHIAIDLEFIKPFAARNVTEFTFKQDGEKTSVTWTMTGKNNFISKAFSLVMNVDKMVGGDFEKGLAQIKSLVESAQKAP